MSFEHMRDNRRFAGAHVQRTAHMPLLSPPTTPAALQIDCLTPPAPPSMNPIIRRYSAESGTAAFSTPPKQLVCQESWPIGTS